MIDEHSHARLPVFAHDRLELLRDRHSALDRLTCWLRIGCRSSCDAQQHGENGAKDDPHFFYEYVDERSLLANSTANDKICVRTTRLMLFSLYAERLGASSTVNNRTWRNTVAL